MEEWNIVVALALNPLSFTSWYNLLSCDLTVRFANETGFLVISFSAFLVVFVCFSVLFSARRTVSMEWICKFLIAFLNRVFTKSWSKAKGNGFLLCILTIAFYRVLSDEIIGKNVRFSRCFFHVSRKHCWTFIWQTTFQDSNLVFLDTNYARSWCFRWGSFTTSVSFKTGETSNVWNWLVTPSTHHLSFLLIVTVYMSNGLDWTSMSCLDGWWIWNFTISPIFR